LGENLARDCLQHDVSLRKAVPIITVFHVTKEQKSSELSVVRVGTFAMFTSTSLSSRMLKGSSNKRAFWGTNKDNDDINNNLTLSIIVSSDYLWLAALVIRRCTVLFLVDWPKRL
jgi:hypothetical protein